MVKKVFVVKIMMMTVIRSYDIFAVNDVIHIGLVIYSIMSTVNKSNSYINLHDNRLVNRIGVEEMIVLVQAIVISIEYDWLGLK